MTKTAFAELLQKTARAQRSARRLDRLQKCAQFLPRPNQGLPGGPRKVTAANLPPTTPRPVNGYGTMRAKLNPTGAAATFETLKKIPAQRPVTKAQQAKKPLTPGGVQAAPKVNPLDDITNRLSKGVSLLAKDPKAYFGQLGKRLGLQ